MHETREEWLNAMLGILSYDLAAHGWTIPANTTVSTGFPSMRALSARSRAVGQCWLPNSTKDGSTQIYVSPTVDDALKVGEIVCHEMCHASVGAAGHGPQFKWRARAMGLTGPMTATVASPLLTARLQEIIDALGPYPHAAIDATARKRQPTRLLKFVCPQCGTVARLTERWTGNLLCDGEGRGNVHAPARLIAE